MTEMFDFGSLFHLGMKIKELNKEPIKEPIKDPNNEPIKEPIKEPFKEPIKESIKADHMHLQIPMLLAPQSSTELFQKNSVLILITLTGSFHSPSSKPPGWIIFFVHNVIFTFH